MLPLPPAIVISMAAVVSFGEHVTASSIPWSVEGYYSVSNSWEPITCDYNQTYVRSSTFGRCCDNTLSNCGFGTSCTDSTIYYSTGSSVCASGQTCAIMNIYESMTSDPSMVDLFCWSDWKASTIFRTTDATATPTSALATSTGIAPGAIITASNPSPTSTVAVAASNHSKPHESKAWIAGAVIGPIAGCVLIGALGFWGRRQIRAKKRASAVEVPLNPVQKFPSAREAVEIGTSGTQGIPELGPSSLKGLDGANDSPAVELPVSSRHSK